MKNPTDASVPLTKAFQRFTENIANLMWMSANAIHAR